MKKMILAVAAAGLVATGSAMAQTVYSVNVVGFQKIQIPPGGFAFSSTPFLSATQDINGVIGEQGADIDAPNPDKVFTWNGTSYETFQRLPATGNGNPGTENKWADASFNVATVTIAPGGGFIWQNAQTTTQEVVVVGEVVDLNGGSITNTIPLGFSLLSYGWSSDIGLNASSLATVATEGDEIFIFETDSQSYKRYEYLGDVGEPTLNFKWVDAEFNATTVQLTTGLSFFYRNNGPAAIQWIESQPYDLDQP